MKLSPSLPKQIRHRTVLCCLFVVGLLIVWGCSYPLIRPNAAEPEQIFLGVIASLSGDAASIGRSTIEGAKLAANEVNQAGGLQVGQRSYTIVLIVEDDHDEVDTAVNAARKLIYQDNVVAIVGPALSRNAIPVAKFVENAEIPMISPRSTNPETTAGKRYVFRATFTDPFQGQVMATFAYQDLQATTAAVLYDVASPYNRGIADVFKQVFEAEGGRIVAFETYTTGEKTFSTQLATIQDQHPDVLFLPNYNYEVLLQAEQAHQAGIEAVFLGADAWGSLSANARQFVEGAFFSDQYFPNTNNPKTQAFIQRYRQAYHHEPDASAAASYDTLYLLFQAMQNQKQFDAESIRQGLAKLGRYDGVTGTIEYQGSGDPLRSVVILHIKNGQPVFYKQVDP